MDTEDPASLCSKQGRIASRRQRRTLAPYSPPAAAAAAPAASVPVPPSKMTHSLFPHTLIESHHHISLDLTSFSRDSSSGNTSPTVVGQGRISATYKNLLPSPSESIVPFLSTSKTPLFGLPPYLAALPFHVPNTFNNSFTTQALYFSFPDNSLIFPFPSPHPHIPTQNNVIYFQLYYSLEY